jgi:hypothetical protein
MALPETWNVASTQKGICSANPVMKLGWTISQQIVVKRKQCIAIHPISMLLGAD